MLLLEGIQQKSSNILIMSKLSWEHTIEFIRQDPNYRYLVEKAYFEADLPLNIERFRNSEEYKETLKLFNDHAPNAKSILDVGSGNGISAISFALSGYQVVACEPDPSTTIGAGAIKMLKQQYNLEDLVVLEDFAENVKVDQLFDIVYVRQAMHHAYHLNDFIKNLSSLLKPGGLLVTVRDHVIYDDKDKEWFLNSHPLHRFYGGENAFTLEEYQNAFKHAGLVLLQQLGHYDSVINYFPLTIEEVENGYQKADQQIDQKLQEKLGFIGRMSILKKIYKWRIGFSETDYFDETKIPGRSYTFVLKK